MTTKGTARDSTPSDEDIESVAKGLLGKSENAGTEYLRILSQLPNNLAAHGANHLQPHARALWLADLLYARGGARDDGGRAGMVLSLNVVEHIFEERFGHYAPELLLGIAELKFALESLSNGGVHPALRSTKTRGRVPHDDRQKAFQIHAAIAFECLALAGDPEAVAVRKTVENLKRTARLLGFDGVAYNFGENRLRQWRKQYIGARSRAVPPTVNCPSYIDRLRLGAVHAWRHDPSKREQLRLLAQSLFDHWQSVDLSHLAVK